MDGFRSENRPVSKIWTIRRVAVWFALNTLLGITLAFFISPGAPVSSGVVLIYGLLLAQIIASFAEIAGHTLAIRFRHLSFRKMYGIALAGSVLAAVIACSLCVFLMEVPLERLFHYRHYHGLCEYLLGLYLPSAVLTAIIASIVIYLEYRTNPFFAAGLNGAADSTTEDPSSSQIHPIAFSFRQNSEHVVIPFQDILYLSARGMKTILHTVERDYETGMLLKKAGTKLPQSDFLRVHKSHIVNVKRIARLQYFMGGSYLAFLNDADETELPVGRKYATGLKQRMGID